MVRKLRFNICEMINNQVIYFYYYLTKLLASFQSIFIKVNPFKELAFLRILNLKIAISFEFLSISRSKSVIIGVAPVA